MPKNEKLTPVEFPMKLRFGEKPRTRYRNDLDALKVELVDWPDPDRVRQAAYRFINATWEDEPGQTDPEAVPKWRWYQALEMALSFRALPTVLENLDFLFLISGIDVQAVTHLIRHRTGGFSAQCTGDRWQSHADALVPGPVQNSPEFLERWQKVVEDAKQLYVDMIDSRKISIMDARTILPKALSTHYYARFNLKDLIAFIQQRKDRQIQPTVDNLMAYYMFIEVASFFPEILTVVDFHAPAMHYVKTARTGKATNLYWPDADSDKFEWHPNDFIYQCERDEVNGTDPTLGKRENFRFTYYQKNCDDTIADMRKEYNAWKDSVGFKE